MTCDTAQNKTYRGKRKDNGEWVYGSLLKWQNQVYISDISTLQRREKDNSYSFGRFYEIIPETYGEFVGIKDCAGKKIFEDDIVTVGGEEWRGTIRYDLDDTAFIVWPEDDLEHEPYCVGYYAHESCVTVIGNIHDNPGLYKPVV